MRTALILLLVMMCCSCRSIGRALANDFERKVGEITEEKVEQLVEKKIGELIVTHLPTGIGAGLAALLGLKWREERKKNGHNKS